MRMGTGLVALALLASLFSGCLGDDEPSDDGALDPTDAPPGGSEPRTGTPSLPPPNRGEGSPPPAGPYTVLAHIDTGVNPYHAALRDHSPLAFIHPSRYIPGYPADTPALRLTLDAPSWSEAREQDAEVWEAVESGTLYWIPGTRIVGAISLSPGGTREDVEETLILDDHGHGTMTGSRAVAASHALGSHARLVTVEGLGAESVRWAADQGWIDVQTNSWGSLFPHPVDGATGSTIAEAFREAGERMVTVEASGNGLGGFFGVAPCSTYTWAQGPPGVILVGAHDNGYVAAWSCSPPHVVADGFRPWAAVFDDLTLMDTHAFSCCTSAAAPYAAGAAAGLIHEARTLLGHEGTGVLDGVLAQGEEGVVADGPLADGDLTLEELRHVLLRTAQARPVATEDDGETHWLSSPGETPQDPTDPGANAYCAGCVTLFVPYEEIPPEVPAMFYLGYGAINVFSQQLAIDVLRGAAPLPERPSEDSFFETDQTIRETIFP